MQNLFHLLLLLSCLCFSSNADLVDNKVQCFRLQDSQWGHFQNCSCTRPLPLKAQTTFTLDKNYTWQPALSYSVYLMDGQTHTQSLTNCFHGVPSEGNKTKGTNLTLSITCNSLPRPLQQNDMIKFVILFPNLQWLQWAIPIPGFSDYKRLNNQFEQKDQQNFKRFKHSIFRSKKLEGFDKIVEN